jgi:hypothetical protein
MRRSLFAALDGPQRRELLDRLMGWAVTDPGPALGRLSSANTRPPRWTIVDDQFPALHRARSRLAATFIEAPPAKTLQTCKPLAFHPANCSCLTRVRAI